MLEMEDNDRRKRGIRDSEPQELWEFSVVELAVDESVLAMVGVRCRGDVRA